MRRSAFIILMSIIFLGSSVYALDTALLDIRNKIFEESKEIKPLLADSKDVVLMSSMWDSCIMAISQIDAYFYMLRIFNTIETEDLKEDSVNSLIDWLNQMKKTNELNIKSLTVLKAVSPTIEAHTEVHMERLRDYFNKLNNQINLELEKISPLKKLLKI